MVASLSCSGVRDTIPKNGTGSRPMYRRRGPDSPRSRLRPASIPEETALKITKTLGVLSTAAIATTFLTACATSSGGASSSAAAAGGGAASANANCALVGSPDPGNSAPPTGGANARGAPKPAQKTTSNGAFSQNGSKNPWALAGTPVLKEAGAQA